MSPSDIEPTPFVQCCLGAVVILAVFLAWLALHAEATRDERDADTREAGEEWGNEQ